MGRTNRRRELVRYRQHLRECLADKVAGWEAAMHPDFGLTDQDAADAMSELEKELREPPKPLLMVTASTKPDTDEQPGYCLGMRFGTPDDVAHIEKLLVKQVRGRYPEYQGMKPRQVRKHLVMTVWALPEPGKPVRGGWPLWLGPTGYYYP